MSKIRTLFAGAAVALAVTLGVSAPAMADNDRDRRFAPPQEARHWDPRPPRDQYWPRHGWHWVCRHRGRDCHWVRDHRRYAGPHYPYPRPPVYWQQPRFGIYGQLNF